MKYIYPFEMNKSYTLRSLWLIISLFLLSGISINAQYTTNAVELTYEDPLSWSGGSVPPTPFYNSVTISNGAIISKTGDLQCTNPVSIIGRLNVEGSVTNSTSLTVDGSLYTTGNLIGSGWGPVVINPGSVVNVDGTYTENSWGASVKGNLTVGGQASFPGWTLESGATANFGSLSSGATTVKGNVTVTGAANLTGALLISNGVSSSFGSLNGGEITVNGNMGVAGATNLSGALSIANGASVTLNSTLNNSATVNVDGSLNVLGSAEIGNGLNISSTGVVNFSGDLDTKLSSISSTGKLNVEGDVICGNGLIVENGSIVEIKGNLIAKDVEVKVGGVLIVKGAMTVNNGLTVNGDCVVLDDLVVKGITVVDDETNDGNLIVGGDNVSISGWSNTNTDGTSSVYLLNPAVQIVNNTGYDITLDNTDGHGDVTDFLTNEAGNTTLVNIVSGLNLLPVTWYSLASGLWSEASIWTLDPSGALAMNGGITTGPRDMDNYVIRSGKTVTVSGAAEVAGIVTVNGELDLGTVTGSSFTKLKGSGRLVLHGDNYPVVGDDSHFVSAGQGEGTVVLKGSGRTMSQLPSDDLFDLEVALTGGAVVIDQDLNLNGDLNVLSGTLQINGTTATERSISVQNVTINSVASMTVGTGAEFHWLNVNGDFKNYGSVLFTNSASYAEATNGAVKVKFTGTTNNDLVAGGFTKFYRLFLNKGTDKTYILSVNATAAGLFSLEGPVSGTSTDDKDGGAGWEGLPLVLNAGTLKLESNINLTRLGENRAGTAPNEFHIPYTSRLWINGANVSTASGAKTWGGITLYGTLHVSKGSFTTPEKTGGITYYTNASSPGMLLIDGTGVVNTTQLKSGNDAGRFSYVQRGGVLNINAVSDSRVSSAVFALPHDDDSFEMSAGEIIIRAVNRYSSSNPVNLVNGIHIALKEGNYNVTGGAIRVLSPALDGGTESNFVISSSIPFYNLSIENSILGADEPVVLQQPLTVLNDLTIASGKSLNASGKLLSIGGNFTNNGTYTTGDNITRFIGAGASLVTGGTTAFNHLELEKDASSAVVTLGAGTISIAKNLTLTSGTLNVGTTNRNIAGSIEIVEGAITGTASLVLNGATQQTIKGKVGAEQGFGNINLNNSNGLKLLSDINVTTFSFAKDGVVDLNVYNLDINSSIYTTAGSWSNVRMFATAGLASNKGLTLPVVLNATYSDVDVQVFPIGYVTYDQYGNASYFYTPATVKISSASVINDSGKMTIRHINDNHPTVEDPNSVINFYWKVNYSGLTKVSSSNMRYVFTHFNNISDIASGRGMILSVDNEWIEAGAKGKVRSGKNLIFGYGDPLMVDYTYGANAAFNKPRTLYSITSGSFGAKITWSTTGHNGSAMTGNDPKAYDMYIIGGNAGINHQVTITGGEDASQIEIKGKSQTGIGIGDDAVAPPTLIMASTAEGPLTIGGLTGTIYSGNNLQFIKGKGRFLIESPDDLPTVDFTDFVNNDEAIFEYRGSNPYSLPIETYYLRTFLIGSPQKVSVYDLVEYPNLHVSGSGVKSGGNADLYIHGNLYVNDATFNVSSNTDGDLTILKDVKINTGNLILPNNLARNIDINGKINITGTGDFKVNTGGSAVEHQINLSGDITQGNGDINFSSTATAKVNFKGLESATYTKTGSGLSTFHSITIEKPVGKRVYFDDDFTLNGAKNGTIKALTLTSGECYLDDPGINIDLSTGGSAFKIPSTSILRVGNGATVNVSGNGTGIWLDGALIVEDKGIVNASGTADNYIEFTASGNSKIEVNGTGKLYVGSQVRRSLNTEAGVLKFYQNSSTSTVVVGEKGAGETSRGVLELPEGSVFTQAAGAKLSINNGQAANSFPDLYFMPSTCTLGAGSEIIINGGDATNPFEIYATKTLAKLITGGTSHVRIKTYPLSVGEDLTLGSGTNFDANGLDLNLYGHFMNGGTFKANGNTTYFVGTNNQNISGATTFYNLEKTTSNTLTLANANATVSNDLTIGAGILSTGDYNLYVGRDVVNDGTTNSTGASDGVIFNSGNSQQLSGVGTWSRLAITNTSEVLVPVQVSPIVINDRLKLNGGVFNIGQNLMSLGVSASIVHGVNDFSSTNMVQTHLSFTDNGIKKVFPQISAPTTFTYPVGSPGKYTPVIMSITSNGNNTGSIRVKAANEKHISIQDDPETTIDETQNVLQYNWTLDATGMENFSADVTMKGLLSDAKVTSGNQLSDYITANILLSETKWNKNTNDDYNEGNGELYFKFDGTDDLGIDGDYTAGISSCIPNNLPVFISVNSGTWKDKLNWATYDPVTKVTGAAGVGVPAGGPRGSIIYVNTPIRMLDNSLAAYRTYIQSNGILSVEGTYGHRLGDVSGTGLLKLDLDVIPAGVYDNFFATTGGTLEYTSVNNGNYSILGDITAVNNLTLSGNGTRNFPANDVLVRGKLTINGPVVDNVSSRSLTLLGDVELAAGSYNPRSGKWILAGTSLQNVIGNIGLYDLQMNNELRADIHNACSVSNVLTLTKGILNTGVSTTGSLTITNPLTTAFIGGSATSYVDGPLRKEISNTSNFTFPVGDESRYGQLNVSADASSGGIWEVEYYNHSAKKENLDPALFVSPIKSVSQNEYWKVKAPALNNVATLTMHWDANSGVNEDTLVVAKWEAIAWNEVTKSSVDKANKSVVLSPLTFDGTTHYITYGAISIPSYTWTGTTSTDWFVATNWSNKVVPTSSSNVKIPNTANKPFIGIGGIAQTNNLLIVDSSSKLTLDEGGKLTVNGNITNNGTLVLVQTYAKPSSFIHLGSITYGSAGKVDIQHTYEGSRAWYFGLGMDSKYNDYSSVAPSANLIYYDTNAKAWVKVTSDEGLKTPMRGYSENFGTGASYSVSHQGSLYEGDQSIGLVNSGDRYNWVANPYTSYVDLKDHSNWVFDNIESTVWQRTKSGGVYSWISYNLATNVGTTGFENGLLAPLQGFLVKAKTTLTGDSKLKVYSTARLHASTVQSLKSANVEEQDYLRLKLSNANSIDESIIVFRNIGNDTYVSSIDSEKKIDNAGALPQIFSNKSDVKLVINVMPENPVEYTIPIYIRVGAAGVVDGELTLNASNITSFLPGVDVYLRDLGANNKVINLRETPGYTFKTGAVTDYNRFELFFEKSGSSEVVTDVDVKDASEQIVISAIALGSKSIVKVADADFEGDVVIDVYDAKGSLLNKVVSSQARTEVAMPENTQVTVLKVTYKDQVKSFKLMRSVGL